MYIFILFNGTFGPYLNKNLYRILQCTHLSTHFIWTVCVVQLKYAGLFYDVVYETHMKKETHQHENIFIVDPTSPVKPEQNQWCQSVDKID